MIDTTIERYDAGESGLYVGKLQKPDPTDLTKLIALPKSEITTLVLNVTDSATGAAVNARTDVDVLTHSDFTVNVSDGGLRWIIKPGDTNPLSAVADRAEHLADFVCTTTDGQVLKFRHVLVVSRLRGFCRFEELDISYRKDISETDRLFVEMMIDAFTRRAEKRCGRILRGGTVTDVFSPMGDQWSVMLSRWPIVSITSVKEALDGDFENATAFDQAAYRVVGQGTPGDEGILRFRARPLIDGIGSLQVVYVAADPVQEDLRHAAMRQVSYWHQRKAALGVSGESRDGHSTTFYETGPFLKDVEDVLRDYRRKVPSF